MKNPAKPPHAKFTQRALHWLVPTTLLALAPKCLVCVLAYAGLGAALGLGGPELCGSTSDAPTTGISWLALTGVAIGLSTAGCIVGLRTLALKKRQTS